MSKPLSTDVLTVRHFDERETRYENVRYWLWREGVSIWLADGNRIDHDDVLEVHAG